MMISYESVIEMKMKKIYPESKPKREETKIIEKLVFSKPENFDIEEFSKTIKENISGIDLIEDLNENEVALVICSESVRTAEEKEASKKSGTKDDPLFAEAVKVSIVNGSASTAHVQRMLAIGYSRAARLVDTMEELGYISPHSGVKQREILITKEQYKEIFGTEID